MRATLSGRKMGNYALNSHLMARLGTDVLNQLMLPNMPLTSDEYLDFMIENAEEFIDAYISKYYDTPVVTDASNGFLRELTLDLAECEIWKRAVGDDIPTKYKTTCERAMAVLKDIGTGVISPFPDSGSLISIELDSDTAVMNEDSLKYF